jgi:ATP-dependent Clp protease ATP-binding subunit ClpA
MYHPEVEALVAYASGRAAAIGHDFVTTDHLLLSMLEGNDNTAAATVAALGGNLEALSEAVNQRLMAVPRRPTPALSLTLPLSGRLKRCIEDAIDLAGEENGARPAATTALHLLRTIVGYSPATWPTTLFVEAGVFPEDFASAAVSLRQ